MSKISKNILSEIENYHLVIITEHDRFSGPEVLEKKLFASKEEAVTFCNKYNSKNTEKIVPDYYVTAEYKGKLL